MGLGLGLSLQVMGTLGCCFFFFFFLVLMVDYGLVVVVSGVCNAAVVSLW